MNGHSFGARSELFDKVTKRGDFLPSSRLD